MIPDARRLLATATAAVRATARLERLDRVPRALLAMAPWGPTLAGAFAASTARYPQADVLIDDDGAVTSWQLWLETDALARELRRRDIGPGSVVGVLGRNHRRFVRSVLAAAKVGADVVYLNPSFAAPQLAGVVDREAVTLVLHDAEFTDAVAASPLDAIGGGALDAIATQRSYLPLLPTRRPGRQVVLTSGTTGQPKGAARSGTGSVSAISGLLSVPLRARDTVVVAAPLVHAWGLAHLATAVATSSTIVLRGRFDAETTLADIATRRAGGLVVVPVMLRRILELDDSVLSRHDTSSLRYIASSGSALGAPLVRAIQDRFGPILYNVYGSTEVALATIATPSDLTEAPATAGRAAPGSTVKVFDESGHDVPSGDTGRIFVGNAARFDGYTGGGGKETIDGLVATGDVGWLDDEGRLFVDGRDDDMIVSGGENVFPAEVEDLLAAHPDIVDAAVVGVANERYGQVLHALVVRRPGSKLTKPMVRTHVKQQLAGYKVPKVVTFRRALPRTETCRLLRRDLD
ncbi:long-chain-fatty-acid--CoA ligase FadD2 [soil metagenome]